MRSHVFHTKKFTCCIIKNINFSLLISIIVLAKVVLLYYFKIKHIKGRSSCCQKLFKWKDISGRVIAWCVFLGAHRCAPTIGCNKVLKYFGMLSDNLYICGVL